MQEYLRGSFEPVGGPRADAQNSRGSQRTAATRLSKNQKPTHSTNPPVYTIITKPAFGQQAQSWRAPTHASTGTVNSDSDGERFVLVINADLYFRIILGDGSD